MIRHTHNSRPGRGQLGRCSAAIALALSWAAGCGSDGPSLEDFLPHIPAPTGQEQSTWAGVVADNTEELVAGPAATGLPGDFYMRNSKGRYVIQAPGRFMGLVPHGGNLIDAVPVGMEGVQDHFGELSFMYLLGRTCDHRDVAVIHDGSGGGAAVVMARGLASANDFVNLRGVGLFDITPDVDPDIDDGVECATTYILEPDANYLSVKWTLFNPGEDTIRGPFTSFNHPGGSTHPWTPRRGFRSLSLQDLATVGEPQPVEYGIHQSPVAAYGLVPRHGDPETPNAAFLVSGVSLLLFGADTLPAILDPDSYHLQLPGRGGVTYGLDVVLGRDAADVEEAFRAGRNEATAEVSGTVLFASGDAATGARVGLFEDADGDGAIGPDEPIASYIVPDQQGNFTGQVVPGNYLVRAEVEDLARSDTVAVDLTAAGDSSAAKSLAFTLPDPVHFDYSIQDGDGNAMPARITVLGRHPAVPDERVFDSDRQTGVVRMVHSVRGTTVDIGDGEDPRLAVPAPGTYRFIASRGTEYSIDSQEITVTPGMAAQTLSFTLHRVIDTAGYISSEYHVHQVASPDSAVPNASRVASMVAEGIELFASTDHDYVSDLQPVVEELALTEQVRAITGVEVTTFSYGHFNAWPMDVDTANPNRGAVDWAYGTAGYSMIPGEIFADMRKRGAEMVQVNHPRSPSGGVAGINMYFDRAGLTYDYETRQIVGDFLKSPVPNEWLRLPDVSLWDEGFNALEVWNRTSAADTNDDGVREIAPLDLVMRDWFNFLSLGFVVTPLGNSDTHAAFSKPAGMPRTYVRVGDDSLQAVKSGNVVPDAMATFSGQASRDIVVSNGPYIQVSAAGQTGSAIGQILDGQSGSVTLDIEIVSPAWAEFDTLEIFANSTPEVPSGRRLESTALKPLLCFTSRAAQDMRENDVCKQTPTGPQALDVKLVSMPGPGSVKRYEASLSVPIARADIVNREGATGADAWLVVRVRGDRAVFPLLLSGVVSDDTIDTLVSGTDADRDAVLRGAGIPATAFTAAIFVDFDGGGYTAVFSPQ